MWSSAFLAFLHFAAVFGIVGTLSYEWMVFSRNPSLAEARRIQQCDRWYGAFAVALLAVGFLRVVYFEKGPAFYLGNPFFHLKIGLFVLVGLLSIYPTVKFIGWSKATRAGVAPDVSEKEFTTIRRLLRLELLLLLAVTLSASIMSRGLGL